MAQGVRVSGNWKDCISNKMSRDKDYQRLLNSKRWKELRMLKLEQSPLCELCAEKGLVVAAVDVHHIQPCEEASSLAEMEARCFSFSNLQSLCIQCHAYIHRKARSHTKESHKQREKARLERWLSRRKQTLRHLFYSKTFKLPNPLLFFGVKILSWVNLVFPRRIR